jgi:FAD/FMN-containing dehydrogenase
MPSNFSAPSCLPCTFLFLVALGSTVPRAEVVRDASGLDPVPMAAVLHPRNLDELVRAVRESRGPLSIGGGRYSMGGHTATPGGTQIDMRTMDHVLAIDTVANTVLVEAGTTWRALLEALVPLGRCTRIQQSYASFTVGGALSVNAHGRYVGEGPASRSVRSLVVVLPDGEVRRASRTENVELFRAALGGYGGAGVIAQAELDIVPNHAIRRWDTLLALEDYPRWFSDRIRHDTAAILHNADVQLPAGRAVRAVTWNRTSRIPGDPALLTPIDSAGSGMRLGLGLLTGTPFGQALRRGIVDPLEYLSHPVVWRSHEASLDVASLGLGPRSGSTWTLQEYFVPEEEFLSFARALLRVLSPHHRAIANISIRHSPADTTSFLTWAPQDVFSFVLFLKSGTDSTSRAVEATWTRELVDSVLVHRGRPYLPYQRDASLDQFHRAYPGWERYQEVRKEIDPRGRLHSLFLDTYLPLSPTP